jgi:hypothetical protein
MNQQTRRELNIFDQHALAIAKRTLSMPDAMLGVMGGMNKEQAKQVIRKLNEKINQ